MAEFEDILKTRQIEDVVTLFMTITGHHTQVKQTTMNMQLS